MRGGDLDASYEEQYIVVMEGVLCTPKITGRLKKKLAPPEEWEWYITALKRLSYLSNINIAIEVATFLSQEAADFAADFFSRYGIPVAEVVYYDFELFTRTLLMRRDLRAIYDSDPARFNRYGQYGVATVLGEDFQ